MTNKELIEIIKNKQITLEICPTSNICTSIYKNISEMPIKKFINKGINITINTDDTTVCDTNLKQELKLISNAFNLSEEDIKKLQINAIKASFASKEIKKEIIEQI